MTCRHCTGKEWDEDTSGNRIFHTECSDGSCSIAESPCLCKCHMTQ